jgi:IS30 family transposase
VLRWRIVRRSTEAAALAARFAVAQLSAVATLVERHSRFVMLVKVANKDTESVVSALIKQSQRLPSELYRSLTWDRGTEQSKKARRKAVAPQPQYVRTYISWKG